MQLVMLALSILLLTVIAGNDRLRHKASNVTKVMKAVEVSEETRLPVKEVENDFSIRGVVIDIKGI